jgi:hypothetical protein
LSVVLQQLFAPLSYLRISHPSKVYFDWVVPALLAIGFVGLWLKAPVAIPLGGVDGVVPAVTEFVKFLAGFYITALAAIATFDRPGMDELMKSPPTLDGAPLSRRRFLARMFGYLAFLSIALYVTGVLATMAAPSLFVLINNDTAWLLARVAFLFVYALFAMSLVTSTLLSLYFLSDRIIRNDPKVVPSEVPPTRSTTNTRS